MDIKPFEKRIWLSSPTMHGEEQAFVKEAFDTNWVSTVGANIDGLEAGIRERLGCGYSVALGAGTEALHLALKLTGVKPKDRVFCTDMTFSATVNPVSYEHAKQVFIDSEYLSWNMDPAALEQAFTIYPDVKVVMAVNLYGTPAQLEEIRAICDAHGATLIEDAAESLGATYHGRPTGTFGTYNAISFNGNKIITTSGGGMLLTDSKEAAELARKWSTQSREAAPWYQHEYIGYNYRMSNIVAGIGRGQLLHLDEHIAAKRRIFEKYKAGLAGLPLTLNPVLPDSESIYWLSCLLIDRDAMCKHERTDMDCSYTTEPGKTCPDEIRETLARYNVESRPIWKPMHMQPIFEDCACVTARGLYKAEAGDESRSRFLDPTKPVNEDIFDRGLCLPSDINMTPDQQDVVIEIIRRCFD